MKMHWNVEVRFHAFLTSAFRQRSAVSFMNWSLCIKGKRAWYPQARKMGGPKKWSQWQRKRSGPLPGIEQQSSSSQSVMVLIQLLQFTFEWIFPISKTLKFTAQNIWTCLKARGHGDSLRAAGASGKRSWLIATAALSTYSLTWIMPPWVENQATLLSCWWSHDLLAGM